MSHWLLWCSYNFHFVVIEIHFYNNSWCHPPDLILSGGVFWLTHILCTSTWIWNPFVSYDDILLSSLESGSNLLCLRLKCRGNWCFSSNDSWVCCCVNPCLMVHPPPPRSSFLNGEPSLLGVGSRRGYLIEHPGGGGSPQVCLSSLVFCHNIVLSPHCLFDEDPVGGLPLPVPYILVQNSSSFYLWFGMTSHILTALTSMAC